jgi:HD superfamily phosphohydrolase
MTTSKKPKPAHHAQSRPLLTTGLRSPLTVQPIRHIQCPIHGGIPVTQTECAVIDHPLFQRLRNIRQLGNAHHVFPSATHTRFSHSVGVMHQASALFQAILRRHTNTILASDAAAQALAATHARIRLAALCHDLGHGPFSHHFEHVLEQTGVRYGDWQTDTLRLPPEWIERRHRRAWFAETLCHEHFSFGAVLNLPFDAEDARSICSLLDQRITPGPQFRHDLNILAKALAGSAGNGLSLLTCLRALLSSDIDADRMDYLQRDAHFCGVAVGLDVDHLLNSIELSHTGARFVIRLQRNAVFAVEQILLARKQMFDQVYMNRVAQLMDELLSIGMHELMRLGRLAVPCNTAAMLRLTEAAVQEWLAALITNSDVPQDEALQGDLAIKMYLTRCIPVTLATHYAAAHLVDEVKKELVRTYPDARVVCQPQKELIKASHRDSSQNHEGVLFSEVGPKSNLVPVQKVSELIRSSAWSIPQVRILVTRSLHHSAQERGLAEKLRATGYHPVRKSRPTTHTKKRSR